MIKDKELTVGSALYQLYVHKMRSAQAPFGAWAIMKKFIYVCNDKHYIYRCWL